MRRTLGEWEKLWRECWDSNDYADLDSVFADTENDKDVLCEVEIIIGKKGKTAATDVLSPRLSQGL